MFILLNNFVVKRFINTHSLLKMFVIYIINLYMYTFFHYFLQLSNLVDYLSTFVIFNYQI